MSRYNHRRSSCPNLLPLSEEDAENKIRNLGIPYGLATLEYPSVYDDNFPDNISDISETNSYRSIAISNEEKLCQDLLHSGDVNETPKFHKYSYDGYHNRGVPESIPFDATLLPIKPFPKLNYNHRKKMICGGLIVIFFVSIIIIPILFIASNPNSNKNNPETPLNQHTLEYNQYWHLEGNHNSLFYNNDTFGTSIFQDPCIIISDPGLIRNIINSKIICRGQWCQLQKFQCGTESPNCYDIDYIIPFNSPEFPGTCKNITGNLIFVWKKWRDDLLALSSYQATITETTEILGIDNLSYARGIIESCGTKC